MAKELEPIGRQIATPSIAITPNRAFEQLGRATGQIATLVADYAADRAIEYYGQAGLEDAAAGRAPDKLAIGFNKATRAYNDAVKKVETSKLVTDGQELLAQAYAKASDPAKFNDQSVPRFDAEVKGIMQGIVENARPEIRVDVAANLNQSAARVRTAMLDDGIKYHNKQVQSSFKRDFDKLTTLLDNAEKTGTAEEIAAVKAQINEALINYSSINQEIKDALPDIRKKIEDRSIINSVVSEFLTAQSTGKGDEFIANFALRDQSGLTQEQKTQALQQIMSINAQTEQALNLTRTVDKQALINDIDNPLSENFVTSQDDLESRTSFKQLSPLQQQQVLSHYIQRQNGQNAKTAKYANALKEIGLGRAGAVDKSIINDMFTQSRDNVEAQAGRPLTMEEQFAIVQQFQTNVPAFDRLITDKLTSQNPDATLEAGRFYAGVVKSEQDSLINLTGDAAIMGQKMVTLLNGSDAPTTQAVEYAIKQVMRKDDANVAQRSKEANDIWSKNGPMFFQDVFGHKPDAFLDSGAYNIFEESFKAAYVGAATRDEAVRITKDYMRGWSTDPFFEDEKIYRGAPTKELPLSQGTFNISNQIAVGFNEIAKRYNATITDDKNESRKPYKFAGDNVLPDKVSQTEFLERPLVLPQQASTDPVLKTLPWFDGTTQLEVEVGGVKSYLKLQPGPFTMSNPADGYIYGLMAKNESGVYEQLEDPKSHDGLAYVRLRDLDQVLPELYNEEADQRLVEAYKRSQAKQNEATILSQVIDMVESDKAGAKIGDFKQADKTSKDITAAEVREIMRREREKKATKTTALEDLGNIVGDEK